MGYDSERLTTETFEKYKRYIDIALYYQEEKNQPQAFENYIKALSSFTLWLMLYSGNEECEPSEKIKFLIILSDLLFKMALQTSNKLTTIYLQHKYVLLIQEVGKYRHYFDVEDIRIYEKKIKMIPVLEALIQQSQSELTDLSNTKIGKTPDESLRKIRQDLQKISSIKTFPVELEASNGCFIATAVYMTSNHPDLDTFRAFRDQKLLVNPLGRLLVSIYYQVGPNLSSFISNQRTMKNFTHQQLTKLANWMRQQKIIS